MKAISCTTRFRLICSSGKLIKVCTRFCSKKRLGVFLLPPGWDARPLQGHFGGERSICVNMSELKVEHWNSEKDGPLNETSMRNKLKSQGYSCTRYIFPSGTDFPDHTHSVSKKDSIISGQFRFAMLGKEVILQPGDMVVVPAGVVHNASVVGKESVIFFDATKS